MPFVTTPTDPSIARVNLDIEEMEITAQVIFILVSGLLAWHQTLCVCFSVCLFDLLSFVSLTTYFVFSYKRTSVGLPFSRQLIGIHRANLVYCHWCSIWFQTSTSAKKETTIAILMRFVITPKDPTTARVNQDMKETEIIAKVSYFCNLSSFCMRSKALLFLLLLWQYVLYRNHLLGTVEPLHNGHLGDRRKWPFRRSDL